MLNYISLDYIPTGFGTAYIKNNLKAGPYERGVKPIFMLRLEASIPRRVCLSVSLQNFLNKDNLACLKLSEQARQLIIAAYNGSL